jgi:hypothetical protein
MKDPMVVNAGLYGLATRMTNDITEKFIAEFKKGTNVIWGNTWTFDNIVDAIAKYPYESEEGLFLLINPAQKAAFRKNLGDDLKYNEDFVRTGYIGTVCGVPVIVSKAVPAGVAFLATKAAATIFTKKGSETEQERDADHVVATDSHTQLALDRTKPDVARIGRCGNDSNEHNEYNIKIEIKRKV